MQEHTDVNFKTNWQIQQKGLRLNKIVVSENKMENNPTGKASPGREFVSSLTLAFSSTYVIEFITGLFLLDITMAFFGSSEPVSVALTSQLVTISSIVTVIAGLLMGILSVRFSRKALLIIGILCVTVGVLGCSLAPDFVFMQIFYPMEGIGTIVVSAMSFALIGELLAVSKRGKATGWIIAGAPMIGISGTLVTWFFFTDVGSWRYFLLWFALPISLAALISAFFWVPSSLHKPLGTFRKEAYLRSFKQVFLKRSSAGCLIGNMIRHAGLAWGVFGITFFRTQFGLSLGSAALLALGGAIVNVIASITGGQLVNKFGRKFLLVITLLVSSPCIVLLPFLPNLWIALLIHWSGSFTYLMGFPASVGLTLEQAPDSRGMMMSMNGIFLALGYGLGTVLGGTALALFNYTGAVLTFAGLGFVAVTVYFFMTKDPSITMQRLLRREN